MVSSFSLHINLADGFRTSVLHQSNLLTMPAHGAAASTQQRLKQRKTERKRAAQREFLRKERESQAKRAEVSFANLSSDGGKSLEETQAAEFMAAVILCRVPDLDTDAVQFVVDTVRRDEAKDPTVPDNRLEKSALLRAVDKYGEYVRSAKKIEELYRAFDYNKDGVLSRTELRAALQDGENKQRREMNGMTMRIFVSEDDIDFILEQSDISGDGLISRNEVLHALATWDKLVKLKMEEGEAMCCTIL